MKPKFELFGMLISIIVIAGCAGAGGRVTSGIYTSPHDNFTVPIPNMGLGARIQDEKFESSGYVSFHDDLGTLQRIDYSLLPANATVVYRDLIHNVVLPDMQARFPGSKMLHEELLSTNGQEEYFFVLEIPEGSPLVDMKTGKGMDSTRGYLYFISSGYIYSLSAQQGGLSDLLSKKENVKAPISESFDELLNELTKFKKSMQIK